MIIDKKIIPLYDFHLHTKYTDGKCEVNQIFDRAIKEGIDVIIFTEHTETYKSERENWFKDYYIDIKKNQEKNKNLIKSFVGIEAFVEDFEGKVGATNEMLEKSDFILGAVHRYPKITGSVKDLTPSEAIDLEYRSLLGLLNNKEIDSIAHIGATCTKYVVQFPKTNIIDIIVKATKKEIAIEINPIYHRPLIKFIEMCAKENALITLGSNAHGYNDIGYIIKQIKEELYG